MKDYIEERAIGIAGYIIDQNATVRQTAKAFGISKCTVHKEVTERLAQVNPSLAKQARKVLDINKAERHIRGGLATREKYLHPNYFSRHCDTNKAPYYYICRIRGFICNSHELESKNMSKRDRKSTRLNSSHSRASRMPSSA